MSISVEDKIIAYGEIGEKVANLQCEMDSLAYDIGKRLCPYKKGDWVVTKSSGNSYRVISFSYCLDYGWHVLLARAGDYGETASLTWLTECQEDNLQLQSEYDEENPRYL